MTIWTDQDRKAAITQLAQQWGAARGVDVNVVVTDFGSIRDKLGTVAVADAPDVTLAAHDWTGQLAANGLLEPLYLNAATAKQDVTNASKTCTSQQADPNFAATHGGKTFEQFYGNNTSKGKGSAENAFGKCVSQAVSKSVAAQAKTLTTAAKSCKAALKASATNFAAKYGTGRDAFGKCVAATSKTK